MENYSEHIDELIAAYLNGEAGEDEVRELEIWKSSSPENLTYFNQMSTLFSFTVVDDAVHYDTNLAWEKVKSQLNVNVAPISENDDFFQRRSDLLNWLRIAAVLVVSFGIGYWIFQNNKLSTPIIVHATKSAVKDTLPDGSSFYLRENSTLSYTEGYGNKERHLKLKGEAYFKVIHNPDVPFYIEAGLVMIKDIGTAFTVDAPADSDFVEVIVEEGEVYFYKTSGKGLQLVKGDHARFEASTGKMMKLEPVSVNRTAYRTGILDFENMTLEEVVTVIEEVYQVKVELASGVRKCRLTASFKGERLETVLDVISLTLNLDINVEGNTVKIEGLTCRH